MAAITREGFLYEWNVPGAAACQPEWPSFRHDQQGTGNYDADGTPPSAPTGLAVTRGADGKTTVTFRSPGDDGRCGTATRYVADVDGTAVDLGAPVAGGAAYSREVALPSGKTLTVRAADGEAGKRSNLGPPASAAVPQPAGAGSGSGSGSGGTGSGGTGGSGGTAGGGTGCAGGTGGGGPGGGGTGSGGTGSGGTGSGGTGGGTSSGGTGRRHGLRRARRWHRLRRAPAPVARAPAGPAAPGEPAAQVRRPPRASARRGGP